MKKAIKIILNICLILMCILILVGLIMCYKMYKEEKERKEAASIGYTEYDLHYLALGRLFLTFDICPPEYRHSNFFEKYEYSLEKKDLKLEAGDMTEEYVAQFNDLVFNNPLGKDLKIAAMEYGFDEENLITTDWILTHPREICEIIYVDTGIVNRFVGK